MQSYHYGINCRLTLPEAEWVWIFDTLEEPMFVHNFVFVTQSKQRTCFDAETKKMAVL